MERLFDRNLAKDIRMSTVLMQKIEFVLKRFIKYVAVMKITWLHYRFYGKWRMFSKKSKFLIFNKANIMAAICRNFIEERLVALFLGG